MIARDINVSFYIFSLLKYDRIFGKSLEHDTYERVKKKSLTQHFVVGLTQAWPLTFILVFFFYDTFK